MGVHGDRARERALDELRKYLRSATDIDFVDADDFADKVLQRTANVYEGVFTSAAAETAVRRTTAAIYEFYRLRDLTPFGDESPVKLRFGGPDKRTIKFVDALDNWYFSKFLKNDDPGLRKFFREKYLENGAALFGRESSEGLDQFRRAAGEKLAKFNDKQIKTIVTQSVQRARNWAHVGSMAQAEVERCRYVALLDQRTTELCRAIDGKEFRVGPAQTAIERLNQLSPEQFAAEMYENQGARDFNKNPVAYISGHFEDDGKTIKDSFVLTGRAVPPLHLNCRTRLVAIIQVSSAE